MIRSSYFLEVSRKLPHTNMQFSEHQLDIWEFNLILLISETVYLKIASDSIGKALQVIVQASEMSFEPLAVNLRFPRYLSQIELTW